MKFGKIEWMVEYNWIDTPYGKRAKCILCFNTQHEARAFQATTKDGILTYMRKVID